MNLLTHVLFFRTTQQISYQLLGLSLRVNPWLWNWTLNDNPSICWPIFKWFAVLVWTAIPN